MPSLDTDLYRLPVRMTTNEFGSRPRTVAGMLAGELREQILSGRIAPGARLQQNDVASEFNVSTTPVREAFAQLVREGLASGAAHRGVEVFCPTRDDLLEAAQIQELLETAALQFSVPRLTDADLARSRALLDEQLAHPVPDRRRDLELDTAFHVSLLRACPNSRLLTLAADARRRTTMQRLVLGSADHPSAEQLRTIERQHEAIHSACLRRDDAEAAARTVEHIQWITRHLSAQIGRASARGPRSPHSSRQEP